MNRDNVIAHLSNLGRKSVRISQQYRYLMNTQQQNSLPSGISDQMKFICSVKDDQLQSVCQNLMHFAGSRILDLLILYYHTWSQDLRHSYYQQVDKIKNQIEPDLFKDCMHIITKKLQHEKEVTAKTHKSKLNRDKNNNFKYMKVPETATEKGPTPNRISASKRRRKRKTLRKPRISTQRFKRLQVKGVVPSLDNIPKEKLTNSVINLTDTTLTDHHLLLFYLGHSFSPSPPLPNYTKFSQDILEFSYKLRWAYYFSKHNSSSSSNPEVTKMERALIKNNTTKQIKTSHNHTLELYLDMISK